MTCHTRAGDYYVSDDVRRAHRSQKSGDPQEDFRWESGHIDRRPAARATSRHTEYKDEGGNTKHAINKHPE